MRLYRKILVPVHLTCDGERVALAPDSREAVDQAGSLASELGSSVTLTFVFDKVEDQPLSDDCGLPSCHRELDRVAHCVRELGVPCDWNFMFGDPAREILSLVGSGEFDMVIVGTRARPGESRGLVGSTTERIMLESPVAVLVARSHGLQPCMLIASDLTENSDSVVREGLALARARRSPVHLVHACADCSGNPDKLNGKRAALEMQLAKVLSGENPLPRMTTSVEVGSPSDVLWNQARKQGADIVVMGMMGRRGHERILRTNTAEEVFEDLPCSLLTIRPEPTSHTGT